jgi:hypothetical protein
MSNDDEPIPKFRLPDMLDLPPSHMATMVGHFLKGVYADTLQADHPRHMMDLIEQFDSAERRSAKSRQG